MLRNVYPGWWLLAAITFTVAVVSGLTFHSFTFYITPMEETFGWSRAQTSVAAVVNMLVFSISAPLVGGWIDRWGVRSAVLVGTPVTAAGLLLLHFTTSLWQFYLFWGLVAAGRTWLTFIPSFLVAITWFRRRRGVAVSIASAGGVIGGIAVLPVVTRLIDSLGWEGSYLVTGIAVPVSVLPLLLVMRFTGERPPEGHDGEVAVHKGSAVHEYGFREALHTRTYWVIAGAYLLFWMGNDAFQPHLAPFFESRGLSQDEIARLLQATFVMALIGRLIVAATVDRVHALHYLNGAACGIMGLAMLAVTLSTDLGGLVVFAVLYGVGQVGPFLRPLLVARYFGTRSIGALSGLNETMNVGGVFIGPIVGGVIYDQTGTYTPAMVFFTASIALSMFFFATIRPPRQVAAPEATAGPVAAAV